jgi:redox-sensitive bicupin YhaK (pirin superfamily)
VRRPFPSFGLDHVDPFLLLDEMGPADYGPGEAVGAPEHPHRGFETVTYLLEGEFEHEDSAGHRGRLGPGDVQWMTAGAGIVHSEMPSRRIREGGGRVHGFQLWVNLPRREKKMAPRYQELPGARIPVSRSADGLAEAKVIAGEALGARASIDTRTPIAFHDWSLKPGAAVEVPLSPEHQALAYVFRGQARIGSDERPAGEGQMALLSQGGAVRLGVPPEAREGARLLLLSGAPLREPVSRHGPFVMNTDAEIEEALEDFQSGRMGWIRR